MSAHRCMYRKPHPAMISVMAGEIPCSCTSQRRHARTGIILAAVNVIGHSLALCLRGIAANVAKFPRPFEESLLPTFPFVVGCGLVAETVDFPARQFGRFIGSFLTARSRWLCARKSQFHQTPDGFGAHGLIRLTGSPFIDPLPHVCGKPNCRHRVLSRGRPTPLFSYYGFS